MKAFIRKIIPKSLLWQYHKAWAVFANLIYGFPSKKLIVIGVTGTNGKSTTCNLIAKVLEQTGDKVGMMTTINRKIGDKEWINKEHTTTPGRLELQKFLKELVDQGCKYAVVETSSEGLMQNRTWGINYDMAVITNLTPDHLEAHGGFENYKKDKGKLFDLITKLPEKTIDGQKVKKAGVVNLDDENWQFYFNKDYKNKFAYTIDFASDLPDAKVVKAQDIDLQVNGTSFKIKDTEFKTNLVGKFNIYNCLATTCVGLHFGLSLQQCAQGLAQVKGIPGRMELIKQGQDFTVLVDYAHDQKSFEILFDTLKMFEKNKVIHVFGCAGGVRDHKKRPVMGKLSAQNCDIIIVTDEDSYEESTDKILDEIGAGAIEGGHKEGENLLKIPDRKQAIKKACQLAQAGDLVLITGKGHEQTIQSGGTVIDWDDREVAREILKEAAFAHKNK